MGQMGPTQGAPRDKFTQADPAGKQESLPSLT
jgi:hypothetical protein